MKLRPKTATNNKQSSYCNLRGVIVRDQDKAVSDCFDELLIT